MFNTLRLLTASTALLTTNVTLDQPSSSLTTASVTYVPAADVVAVGAPVELDTTLARPHVLDAQLADIIVRIRGGANCTGTPITGTKFVVTAAHCVLDADGAVAASRTVLRNGIEYTPVSVLVNPDYHHSPSPRLDAAVVVMDQILPGPSATLGDEFPTDGLVTLAGFQALDSDGSLLRGTRYDNRPLPEGAAGGVVNIDTAAAGCIRKVSEAQIADDHVSLPCGLIPGASGGGLFIGDHGEQVLVGVISTVTHDLTDNGLVPLAEVHRLLDNPTRYTYVMTGRGSSPAIASAVRS